MYKVLWLVNARLPQIAAARGRSGSSTCGWISGAYDYINERFDLTVVYPVFKKEDAQICLEGDHKFAAYLHGKDSASETAQFAELIKKIDPDVIDVWGTEFERSNNFICACLQSGYIDRTVVSMQGSATEIAEHYASNLTGAILRKKTLRDLLRRDSIAKQIKAYEKRAETEKDSLQKVRRAIGKTDWDEAICKTINPAIEYRRCYEILRGGFYKNEGRWTAGGCVSHSLLLCQGNYPLKGLHIILRAVYILKEKYDDVLLNVAGTPPYYEGSSAALKTNSYGAYIKALVKKLGLQKNVRFIGMKNEDEMVEAYLKTNAVVLASSVENESNSVSEAHLLGVPVVASYSGGVASRVKHGENGYLFPYDDLYLMAFYIDKVFSDGEKTAQMSKNGVEYARLVNDADANNRTREEIYLSIVNERAGSR